MINLFKRISQWFGIYQPLRTRLVLAKSYKRYPVGSTMLVHIGKCGGQTLREAIMASKFNSPVRVVHTKKPIYRKDLKYIIVARAPISRMISAFRWRYKLVVTEGSQRNRFEGEYNALIKYGNINTLAEALYFDDGTPNAIAHEDARKILHIRENISYYLDELLKECNPNQVIAVLLQENLNDDIRRVFGYDNQIRANTNQNPREKPPISLTANENLKKFLTADYRALVTLYCWGKIDKDLLVEIM